MLLFLLFVIICGGLLLTVNERHIKKPIIWLSMGVLWLYWGFSYINAPDTPGYMYFFDLVSTDGWVLDSLYGSSAGGMEPGTFILMQLCKRVSSSYYFFQAIILAIDLFLSYWGLRKLLGNDSKPTTFFLLFAFGTPMYLAAMRQGVAIAIMIFCLPLFKNNKFWLCIPLLILAIFFHQSAILLFIIPAVILMMKRLNLKVGSGRFLMFSVFIICNVCYLFSISASGLVEQYLGGLVYDSSLSTNREMTFTGVTEESNFGILKVIEMDVIYIIFFFTKKNWKTDAHNYLGTFFLVFFVLNMLVGGIVIHRLSYYLWIPYSFILFESLSYFFKSVFRWDLKLANLAIYLYMFTLVVVQDISSGKHIFEYHLLDIL